MSDNLSYTSDILENLPIGCVIVDSEINIINSNKCMLSYFNISDKDYKGKRFGNVFNCSVVADDEDKICGTLAECSLCDIRNGIECIFRKEVKSIDVELDHDFKINDEIVTKWIKISASITKIDEKEYSIINLLDITDSKKLEELLKINDKKYKLLFENMTQGFALNEIITDEDGIPVDYRYLDANSNFELLTGLKLSNVLGNTVKEVIPNIESKWIEIYGKVALTGEPCHFEKYFSPFDKYFDVWAFCPEIGQFAVLFSDITIKKNMEKALKKSENKFKNYIDKAPEGIFVIDEKGYYKQVNNSAIKMTGYPREEILGKNILTLVDPENYHEAVQAFDKLVHTGMVNIEIPFYTKNREKKICSLEVVRISDDEYLGFARDITEKKEIEDKLHYYYYHDSLTRLFNRRYVNNQLPTIDTADNLPLSIIVGDINGLKLANDAFGRKAGDNLIKQMANIAQNICSSSDIIAKWGGDAILILLPKSNEKRAEQITNRIKTACIKSSKSETKLSISFGYATKNKQDINFEDVLSIAEDMMLRNKACESAGFRGQTINIILKTLHAKNKREEQHSRRVSDICVKIGMAMGFSNSEVNKLRVIGLLHDIGKIGIDEEILNKNGQLTSKEWDAIKKHSEIGYRILSSTNETSELAQHVLAHHERLDGNGYPNGISGEDISIITRILSIADAYDAMTSNRAYREGLKQEDAILELQKNVGTQFDPNIVDTFIHKVLETDEISAIG